MTEDRNNQQAAKGGSGKAPEALHRRYFWLLACAWSALVAGSFTWNVGQEADEVRSVTLHTARTLLEKDLHFREWSIFHGAVYVPKSGPAETNSPAQEQEREVVTLSGQVLTMLNPVMVSRQVYDLQAQRTGIRGHITSLRPFNPANRADEWERRALEAFEQGRKEVCSVETVQGEPALRLMQPLVTVPSCLRCHEEAGRKPGTIRGGISVTVPMSRFASPGTNLRLAMVHFGLWLVGMTGLIFGARNLLGNLRARRQAEAEREQLIAKLQEALANVKTLTGLIPICSSCKKVRDDRGYWTQLETYLAQHSEAEFSHGLCLDCMRKLYPDYSGEVEARMAQEKPPPNGPGK